VVDNWYSMIREKIVLENHCMVSRIDFHYMVGEII